VVPGRLLHPFHLEKSAQLAGLSSRVAEKTIAVENMPDGGEREIFTANRQTYKKTTNARSSRSLESICRQWDLLQLESRQNGSFIPAVAFPPLQLDADWAPCASLRN